MKINQITTNNLAEKIDSTNKASSNNKKINSTSSEPVIIFPKDSINFSSATKEIQKLTEKAAEAPDIRQEKVENLRAKVLSGEFNPTADEILDAIIKNNR